ncbi:MAG: penicillin-binding protein activator [Silicimonas sp.]|nr:penicillin-binding protein activator [Silicimonas sp.]
MVALLSLRRKVLSWIAGAVALTALSACDISMPVGGDLLNRTGSVKVALLVPKSSANGSALATSLENAAWLAVADLDAVEIDLKVYDTAGTSQGATLAAQQAISDGARMIVGPLFAESASAAGAVAANRGVNVLAFSNNPAIAGGNVFILGNTFQNSADRLVRFASRQGKSAIYLVHADDPAERLGAAAVEQAIQANGGRLAGTSSFPLSQQGVINKVPEIARNYRASGASSLFVTSGTSGALPFLAELLPENGIDSSVAQFIGLQRLDIPSSALSLKGLQGALFALPSPGLNQQFNNRYQATYGTLPNPIAGLAYDGIAAIGALAAAGAPLNASGITQGQGFAGVGGPFRFFRNGTNERGLAVAQIQNNQVIVIDPAPRSFGGPGF